MLIKVRGSAILSALFIMTLVAIATTTLTLQLKTDLDKTRLLFKTNQFQLDSTFIRYWAMDFLTSEKGKEFGHVPDKTEHVEKNIFFPALEGYHFSCHIIDLNAKFNLNNLRYPTGKTTLYRLIKHLLEDGSDKKSYPLTSALANWVIEYQPGNLQHNTHFTAHLPMVSISEIALIPNVSEADLKPLMPYLTVLPERSKVNLNTAPEDLLMAMSAQNAETVKNMEALIEARGEEGIPEITDVRAILQKLAIEEDDVTTESEYFLSIGYVRKGELTRTLYSLLQRVKNKKDRTYTVHLIHETWNTD